MPVFLLMMKRLRAAAFVPRRTRSKKMRAAGVVGLAALAFVAPPPSGFSVGDLSVGQVAQPGKFSAVRATVGPWVGQMFFVMFSAAIMGLAQMIYVHFTKSWESRGMPMLPINTLHQAAPGVGQRAWSPASAAYVPGQQQAYQQPGRPVVTPAPGQPIQQPQQQQPQGRASVVEEYKD